MWWCRRWPWGTMEATWEARCASAGSGTYNLLLLLFTLCHLSSRASDRRWHMLRPVRALCKRCRRSHSSIWPWCHRPARHPGLPACNSRWRWWWPRWTTHLLLLLHLLVRQDGWPKLPRHASLLIPLRWYLLLLLWLLLLLSLQQLLLLLKV